MRPGNFSKRPRVRRVLPAPARSGSGIASRASLAFSAFSYATCACVSNAKFAAREVRTLTSRGSNSPT